MATSRLLEEILEADRRIDGLVQRTAVERCPALEASPRGRVYLKLENQQHSGSFKLRGATNRILSLPADVRAKGIVAASSGNHGSAVAYAAEKLGCPAVVFVPEHASPKKIAAIRDRGSEVRIGGDDCVVAERHARSFAAEEGRVYVSPYNDLLVVAGQGTVGVELGSQLEALDAIFVAVGGGGLISGIGTYLRSQWPAMKVIACSPERSQVLHASLEAGRILDLDSQPTLSDGTAGGMEADSLTFPLCQELIDESLLVSEDQIRQAWRLMAAHHTGVIEGAAAVAVAAFLAERKRFANQRVGIVICGGNVEQAILEDVLS